MFPLKSIWLQLARDKELAPVRIGISVPKKKTPLAVNRNRTKRLIREAWRLHKHLLYSIVPAEIQFHLFFVYHGDPNPEYQQIEESVLKHIEHLIKIIKREGNA